MNFVDYCIKTKNYSAIKAVNEYTKIFSGNVTINKIDKGDHITVDGKECIVMGTKEADENFGTLVANGFKRLGAGLLVAVPVMLIGELLRNQ